MTDVEKPMGPENVEAPNKEQESVTVGGLMSSKRPPTDSPPKKGSRSKRPRAAQKRVPGGHDFSNIEVEEESVVSMELLPSVDGQVKRFGSNGW